MTKDAFSLPPSQRIQFRICARINNTVYFLFKQAGVTKDAPVERRRYKLFKQVKERCGLAIDHTDFDLSLMHVAVSDDETRPCATLWASDRLCALIAMLSLEDGPALFWTTIDDTQAYTNGAPASIEDIGMRPFYLASPPPPTSAYQSARHTR